MMTQAYDWYTPEDFHVWHLLFSRQMGQLERCASRTYLEAIDRVGFKAEEIPHFTEVNRVLGSHTGWKLQAVPHIVPNDVFFPLLHRRTFTATTWLRPLRSLDYLEEPDMFHDVFGHVPLLSDPTFCAFFHGLATIATEYLHRTEAIEMLGRMYWFTIEFGLIREGGRTRIYGAGIASSYGETHYALSGTPAHLPFSVEEILHMPYYNMRIQDRYFVIESYEQLFASLPQIRKVLRSSLAA